jgi:hypothetical protein
LISTDEMNKRAKWSKCGTFLADAKPSTRGMEEMEQVGCSGGMIK